MPLELKYQFKVSEEGKITIVNEGLFKSEMRKHFLGKTAIVTVRKPRKQRSTRQNSFYFGITIPEIIEGLVDAGYERHELSVDLVHDMLREKFLKVDLPSKEYSGEFISLTRSSTELSTAEWMDYTAEVTRWAAEFLNITLSVPNEQKEIEY